MDIRADYKKGMNCTDLGRKYGIDPRTAKKYAETESKPTYKLSKKRGSILDKYKPTIDEWLKEAPFSAVRIQEKITELGYTDKYTIVKEYVSSKKAE